MGAASVFHVAKSNAKIRNQSSGTCSSLIIERLNAPSLCNPHARPRLQRHQYPARQNFLCKGKTAVTLSKMREAHGRVLYVTLSAYLAQSARALYDAHGYENAAQEAEFLSYRELIETLRVPTGREVTYKAFAGWFERHRHSARHTLGELDAHALFEEFRGVICASPQGPLDLPSYLALGPRQSLLGPRCAQAPMHCFNVTGNGCPKPLCST